MRLLNTSTFMLEEFLGDRIPEYVILSHTWGEQEVTFQDIESGTGYQKALGWRKIQSCCRQAARYGFLWVWIDTCCIDKTSSAELSESINSMYQWYKKACICYVYLEGCSGDQDLGRCRWWTRGWTLQELIAPLVVEFYGENWEELGSKLSLHELITDITGIDKGILTGGNIFDRTVAVRMSWAANRQTTRVEDQAYSLLGLFGVNMPLLYGEGKRAFIRLQEEILKVSEDYTIFVWCPSTLNRPASLGLLADYPADFNSSLSENYRRIVSRAQQGIITSVPKPRAFVDLSRNCFSLFPTPDGHEAPYMTSRGLRITLPMYPLEPDGREVLLCVTLLDERLPTEQMVCVTLFRLGSSYCRYIGGDIVFRPNSDRHEFQYRSIDVIKPRANLNIPRITVLAAASIILLIVELKGHQSKQLRFFSPPRASMADLLSFRNNVRNDQNHGVSDRRIIELSDCLRSLGVEGFMPEDLVAQCCLGNPPEQCWFLDVASAFFRSERIRGFIALGCKEFSHCAFQVQFELDGRDTRCRLVPTTVDALQHEPTHEKWTSDAKEAVLRSDRDSITLSPSSSRTVPAFTFKASIRRVAKSSFGIERKICAMKYAADSKALGRGLVNG